MAKPPKPKNLPSMKLTRQAKVTARKTTPYHVQFGSTNHPDHVKHYDSDAKAKAAIRTAIQVHRPWCERYNRAGLDMLDLALMDADALIFSRSRKVIDRCFDETYGVRVHVEAWMA